MKVKSSDIILENGGASFLLQTSSNCSLRYIDLVSNLFSQTVKGTYRYEIPPKTEVRTLFSEFFTAHILFWEIWELYVLDLKTKVNCKKINQIHFPIDKGLKVPK